MNKTFHNFAHNNVAKRLLISILLSIVVCLFGSVVTSFVYRYSPTSLYVNDASMFRYMGAMFNGGKIPYVEVFDHKGLYIFYYTALGAGLGKTGILFVQMVIYFIFFYFFILCMKELAIKKEIMIIALLFLAALLILSSQSPSDFEPLYPFVTSSIYFYIKGFKNDNKKAFLVGNFVAGLMTGMAINIRASDAMIPLSLVIFYFIYALKNKKMSSLIPNALVCLGGVLITCAPPFLHAYFDGFFDLMIDSVIVSNFRYIGSMKKGTPVQIGSIMILFIIGCLYTYMLIYSWKKKMFASDEWLFYLTTFVVSFLIQCALAYYVHYLLIWVPLLIIQMAAFVNQLTFNQLTKTLSKYASLGLFIVAINFNLIKYYAFQYQVDQAIVTYVDSKITNEDKNGKVLGLMISTSIYLNSNMVAGYPDFTCQHNHIRSSTTYSLERLEAYLLSGECKYLLTQNNYTPDNLLEFVNEKLLPTYVLIASDLPGASYIDIYEYNP